MDFLSKYTQGVLLFLAITFAGTSALASHSEESGHSTTRVYRTALRYLRVNQHYPILEKDESSGYLIFEYPGSKTEKASRGSMEVIETNQGSRLIVRIDNYPSYYEEYLASGVMDKLKNQYGEPKPKPKPKPKPTPTPTPKPDDSEGVSSTHSACASV